MNIESYTPVESQIFGFDYGEQTNHFIKIEILESGSKCIISTLYPNGDLLMGPDNNYPQRWILTTS